MESLLESLPLPPLPLWSAVLVVGLAVLVLASEAFTHAAARLGVAFRLPSFIIGVTILAVGTSMPELVASVLAVLRGAPEIVAGNVVGSNVANLLFILGLCAIVTGHIRIEHELLRVDLPFLVGSAFFLAIILWSGEVSRIEAGFCLVGLVIYMHYALTRKLDNPEDYAAAADARASMLWPVLIVLASAVVIYLGADATVIAVVRLADRLAIGAEIIAASAVALGTSLPEVAVTFAAARQGRSEMAVGNVIGSNVFNAFAVIGASGLILPLPVTATLLAFAVPVMVAATVLTLFIIMEKEMTAWEGWLMVLFYAYFLAALFGLL